MLELNKAALFSRRLLPGGLDSFFCRPLFGQKTSRLCCPRRLEVVDDIINVLERERERVSSRSLFFYVAKVSLQSLVFTT